MLGQPFRMLVLCMCSGTGYVEKAVYVQFANAEHVSSDTLSGALQSLAERRRSGRESERPER